MLISAVSGLNVESKKLIQAVGAPTFSRPSLRRDWVLKTSGMGGRYITDVAKIGATSVSRRTASITLGK